MSFKDALKNAKKKSGKGKPDFMEGDEKKPGGFGAASKNAKKKFGKKNC